MCIVCIANNINRNVYMYLNTRIFPTTGYARVLLFVFIRRELGGIGTGCLFQFTYCDLCNCVIGVTPMNSDRLLSHLTNLSRIDYSILIGRTISFHSGTCILPF